MMWFKALGGFAITSVIRLLTMALLMATTLAAPPIWILPQQARAMSPLMTTGAFSAQAEPEALGEFLLPMVTANEEQPAPDCWVDFTVAIPQGGAYYLWARLRTPTGLPESFCLVSSNGPIHTGELLLQGDLEIRQWSWRRGILRHDAVPGAKPAKLELPPGAWTFRLQLNRAAATTFGPLRWRQAELTQTPRINLLCLSDNPDYVPTDADARNSLRITLMPAPVPSVHSPRLPALDQPPVENRRRVPDWMRCPRWFTKDSWRSELDYRHAGDIATLVREVAANGGQTLRLSCFWGGEAYFQSRVAPRAPGLGDLDYLQEAMTEAGRTGVKIVAYINPNALYPGHPLFPECVIREADGQVSRQPAYGASWQPNAFYPCINHPRYRAFLRELLTEIFTRYQPAGLYVDGLTPHVCACEFCRTKWREMFHSEMPVAKIGRLSAGWAVWAEFGSDPQPVGDVENDPDARQLTELMMQSLVEATHEFTHTVKQAKPDAVTLFHSHPKPGNEADYDGTLTEVYAPQPWVHTAWRSGELAGYSTVYRVPVLFNIYPHTHFTAAEARYHALQGLAAGAYPNFWNVAGMKPVFDFMARCADCLDFETAAPVKFLALPRDLRESETQRRSPLADGVSYAPRNRFLAPYVGAYSALMRSGLPVVTLHRPHFEEGLEGFQVLVLANLALMSDAQAKTVKRFVFEGGGLIATHETSLGDEKGRRRTDFALADVLGVHYQSVSKGEPRLLQLQRDHPLAQGVAGLLNHEEPVVAVRTNGAETVGWLGGLPGVLIHSYGKGRVVYLPGRLDSEQCYRLNSAFERLLANAVRWVAQDRLPVEIQASGSVAVSIFHQTDRLIVHLVNHQRDSQLRSDTFTPINPVSLRVRLPGEGRVKRVRRLWESRDLPFQSQDNQVQVEVGRLGEYEAVAIETEASSKK